MKRPLLIGLALLAIAVDPARAESKFDYAFRVVEVARPKPSISETQCRWAPNVRACVVKLDICLEKMAAEMEETVANYGMALTYHCLEEQGVRIPKDGEMLN